MSAQDFTNYINSWVGKRFDGDSFPKNFEFQCTDWPPKFILDFVGLSARGMRISGGAKDWFEDFPNSGVRPEWKAQRIANTSNGFPMAGDIVVWGSNLGAGYGHVAVSDFNDSPSALNVIEQNGIGNGKGTGGDAIRKYQRPQAPLGWIRIPAVYDKIHGNTTPMFDINSIINNFSSKWNNKLKPWSEDDGNNFGRLRGLWYQQQYETVMDSFASAIQALFQNNQTLQQDLLNRQKLGTTGEIPLDIQTALDNQKIEFEIEKASLIQQILNLQNQIRQYQVQKQSLNQPIPVSGLNFNQVSASQNIQPQYWQQQNTNPLSAVPIQLMPANTKNSSTKNIFQSKKALAFFIGSIMPVISSLVPNFDIQTKGIIVAASTILTSVYMYVQGKVDESNLGNQILTQVDTVKEAFKK